MAESIKNMEEKKSIVFYLKFLLEKNLISDLEYRKAMDILNT